MADDYFLKRQSMVETQLKARDIKDALVLKAMLEVPRHEFMPPELRDISYGDFPLPIGEDQTISQPYIVALMTQELCLKGGEKVLEIGAGSGYQAAVLSRIAKTVYAVERIQSLATHAENVLRKLCYLNVHVVVGDGTLGLAKNAPYDAIIVSAASFKVPDALKSQLVEGGRIVMPVGSQFGQSLMSYVKKSGELAGRKICDCAFVPLIGEDGWEE
ncbi:protein-L-isoaspartate(D-aspartate) O-methyltransferase [Candidatus Woesearchaeota archaeon]|nr:protein-L-isoaspartate(D-aspartate) O-methyltransferase [Candidatus Woesearchaeota archaeon]